MNHATTPPGGAAPGSGTSPQGPDGPDQPGRPAAGVAAYAPWAGPQPPAPSALPNDLAEHRPGQENAVAPTDHHPSSDDPSDGNPPGAAAQPAKPRGGRNLPAAIGVGVGLGAVIVASLFFVKALFLVVVMAAVGIGVRELTSRLAERKDIRTPQAGLAVAGVAMLAAAYALGTEGSAAVLALTALGVLVWRMKEPPPDYLRDVTAGIFTAFYVPFLATFVALMLDADDGPWRVLLFLMVTVCSDTGAYAVGFRFGRTKLAPRISPGKTREGLAGGIALSMLAGALGMQFLIEGGAWWQGLVLGACAAVTATLGDLVESMIKRDLGIKDMGTLLPGHGGIMDRLDSLLPTAPVTWLLFTAFVGA
ncbi:phosphatidate cytidylyltransferase [Streptacidiphilus sp. ASG 303]|uniref:phosphatidate cytidylyltransferase n=1 Tax=Streptacidiphilus sp. ASG 303 TaxID=2896847 RepID=UPI001E366495|nr:phosphatidate cytidylyltransferase [Streptacidiphilus sp. ASG 303]MCD0484979.1 phosphatidate cytidylyltransferase [Streptacidiphilus sp. ASG 303]